MISSTFSRMVWMMLWVIGLSGPVSGQEFFLRNQLVPGQIGRAVTVVEMQGDSLLTGQKAATQLRMRMTRDFQVFAVDGLGNARVDVAVRQIQTQGKMGNTSFNKILTGAELKQVMSGADQATLDISPLGVIREGGDFSFEKLGIILPESVGDSGGFEFPTFPAGPVRVGSMWNEKGILIQPGSGQTAGEEVYQLSQVRPTPQGRVAVIRYKKLTDLSGLGFGGEKSQSTQGAAQPDAGMVKPVMGSLPPNAPSSRNNGNATFPSAKSNRAKKQEEPLDRDIARLTEQAAEVNRRAADADRLAAEAERHSAPATGEAAQPGLRTVPAGTGIGTQASLPSLKASGLAIQLEGEIEFNIDQGGVVKTTQHGFWNLNLDMNNLPTLPNGGSSVRSKATQMTQQMKMSLQTQFQWRKPPTAPSSAVQPKPAFQIPPQLPVEQLPKVTTPPEELP